MRINKTTMNNSGSSKTTKDVFDTIRNAIRILTGKLTPIRYQAVPEQLTRVMEKFDVVSRTEKPMNP